MYPQEVISKNLTVSSWWNYSISYLQVVDINMAYVDIGAIWMPADYDTCKNGKIGKKSDKMLKSYLYRGIYLVIQPWTVDEIWYIVPPGGGH